MNKRNRHLFLHFLGGNQTQDQRENFTLLIDMKEQKQRVSSPLFSALQGKALLEIVLYNNSLCIFCTFIVESPSFESLLDHYHILHLQPMVDIQSRAWRSSSIVGLIVEDLWSEFSDYSKNRFCFVFHPLPLIFLKPC